MNNTPAVRFIGFTEDWKQRKLKDIIEKLTGGASISPDDYTNEGYRTIPKGAVNDTGIANLSECKNVSGAFFIKCLSSKTTSGELVTSLRDLVPTAPNMGRIVRICCDTEEFLMPQGVYSIALNGCSDEDYLIAYSNSPKYRKRITSERNGSTQVHIRNGEFLNIDISLPTYEEQKYIGAFLKSIGSLITLHQRKYEKLVNIKKSMLYKMFPQNGSKVPEIRFAGFSDDWEQQAFEKAFDYLQNNTLSRAELNNENGVAKNVHYGDVLIKFGEYLDISNSVLPYITSQQVTNRFRSSLLKNGDVVMADTAEDETVGKCTELAGISHYPIISGLHTIPLRPKIKFAAGYLGYYMNSSRYHNQLLPLIQGTKVSSISKNALKNTSILFPSKTDEQRLIGQFFIQLDDLIIFHQRKLEKLKQLKQAMLHKMFV